MRIITGSARGIRLATLEGEATRPTAERVKEAVFSSINFELEDTEILDLFGGSGQLGLEALSRGASHAVFVDSSADAAAIIKANAQKTRLFQKCRVLTMDYEEYIRSAAGKYKFDFIFIDPPYALKLVPDVLRRAADADIIADGGTLICETDNGEVLTDEELEQTYEIHKQARYGRIHITMLKLKKAPAEAQPLQNP